jgi:hypothetical protein
MFYRVSASLLTTDDQIQVTGCDATGEVEFLLLNTSVGLLVGLASDHTDRKIEAMQVTLSKQMCPKVLAEDVWDFAEVEPHWDELTLRPFAVTGGVRTLYQESRVSAIRHPQDLLQLYEHSSGAGLREGMAMYGGTFGVIGGLRWADEFAMELEDPVLKRRISHTYGIRALPIEG